MEFTIHYRGKPFVARVAGEGRKPIKCTPVVCESWSSCGVGVLYNEGGGQFWGLFIPRNLIAAWRATEVLSLLDTIETGTLCAAYYTGVRILNESDIETYVNPIIAKIGQEAYNRVMAMAVPEQIIRAILDNQGWGKTSPSCHSLHIFRCVCRSSALFWRHNFHFSLPASLGNRKTELTCKRMRIRKAIAIITEDDGTGYRVLCRNLSLVY